MYKKLKNLKDNLFNSFNSENLGFAAIESTNNENSDSDDSIFKKTILYRERGATYLVDCYDEKYFKTLTYVLNSNPYAGYEIVDQSEYNKYDNCKSSLSPGFFIWGKLLAKEYIINEDLNTDKNNPDEEVLTGEVLDGEGPAW